MARVILNNFFGLKKFHEEIDKCAKLNPDMPVSEAIEKVKLMLLNEVNNKEITLKSSSVKDCDITPGDLLVADSQDGFPEFYFIVKSFDDDKINLWILFNSNKININASIWRCNLKNIRFVSDVELGMVCSGLSEQIYSYMFGDEYKKDLIINFDLDKYFPLQVFEFDVENETRKFLYVFSFMHKGDGKIKHVFLKESNGFYIKEEKVQ